MHGEDIAFGQQEIQNAEDGFFHLTGIFGAGNYTILPVKSTRMATEERVPSRSGTIQIPEPR